MKTGRSRSKEEMPPEEAPPRDAGSAETALTTPVQAAPPPAATPAAPAPRPTRSPLLMVFLALSGVAACLLLVFLLRGCGGSREWVPVTRAAGEWTAGVQVYAPQLALQQAFQADCQAQGWPVRAETCGPRDTQTYTDKPFKTYQEYAANTYFEETWTQVYRPQGTEFVTYSLGGGERWEANLHYAWVETLKRDTCKQTNYTVWVDNPQDRTQEDEVYLFDCEVWNDYTVVERVYDQAPWCDCEATAIVLIGQLASQGKGSEVSWPQGDVPAGGRADRSFTGRVTFNGGDYTFSATTADPAQYRDWLTGRYYLGIRNGRPVDVTQNPPK